MTATPPTTPPTAPPPARIPTAGGARALHLHATLDGRGTAADGTRTLGEVEYALKDVEEVCGPDPDGGARNIFGLVKTVPPALLSDYVGARLALHLADGRRLPITVAKVIGPRIFLIQALGAPE